MSDNENQRIFISNEPDSVLPKKLVILLAVMLTARFLLEDWRFIKDAMRMRDVSNNASLNMKNHRGMTID